MDGVRHREALRKALDEEIERGLAQARSGELVDLDALLDALERELTAGG